MTKTISVTKKQEGDKWVVTLSMPDSEDVRHEYVAEEEADAAMTRAMEVGKSLIEEHGGKITSVMEHVAR